MAMNQKMTYTVGFKADTAELKREMQNLQNSLRSISNFEIKGNVGYLSKEMLEAANAANNLHTILKATTNIDSGKLDLLKFNESLKRSGKSLKDYGISLMKLGPEGEKVFSQIAQSIVNAEIPLRRANKLFDELWVSMKNTARWQLTSSALHTFIGGLQTAYGYSQDLNRSLNEIRIVSEQSTKEMAKFAKEANKAAKDLSSTTIDYTDAALIYYQQGLTDEQIEERTAVTINMANVSRQSAEEVSNQMTAIWNNFYDGSKSLEYYADVITKLGAETASSSQEISAGLEKFAAVAGTVGLSYEYATAALATVTAETRQSAEVVGNAYKTLFARIQGLKLGKTLDDGTTLNKYSQALNSVGISIFDQNNQLKDMDDILTKMGEKWNTLSKDQRVALAQTVAGVRQYNQLVALMDKWDVFQQNLATARGAEGALGEQAETYAESWEAARDRVRAAAEDVYDSLINPEFFIALDDTLTPILTSLAKMIDAFGGMGGAIQTLGVIGMRVFDKQIAQFLRDTSYSTKMLWADFRGLTQDMARAQKQELINDLARIPGASEMLEAKSQQVYLQNELNKNSQYLTQEQKIQLTQMQEQIVALNEFGVKLKENAKIAADNTSNLVSNANDQRKLKQRKKDRNTTKLFDTGVTNLTEKDIANYAKRNAMQASFLKEAIQGVETLEKGLKANSMNSKEFEQAINQINNLLKEAGINEEILLNETGADLTKIDAELILISNRLELLTAKNLEHDLNITGEQAKELKQLIDQIIASSKNAGKNIRAEVLANMLPGQVRKFREEIKNIKPDLAHTLTSTATAFASINGVMDTSFNIIQNFNNEQITATELAGNMAAAITQATIALTALKPALDSISASLEVKNWKVLLVLAAIALLAKGVIWLADAENRASEELQELNQEYTEQKNKVDNLTNSLSKVNEELAKLHNQGPLTLVEQQELAKLKEQKGILEEQLRVENEILNKQREKKLLALEEAMANDAYAVERAQNYYNQSEELAKNPVMVTDSGTAFVASEVYRKANIDTDESYQEALKNYIDYIETAGKVLDPEKLEILQANLEKIGQHYYGSIQTYYQTRTSDLDFTSKRVLNNTDKANLRNIGINTDNYQDFINEQVGKIETNFNLNKKDLYKVIDEELTVEEFQYAISLDLEQSTFETFEDFIEYVKTNSEEEFELRFIAPGLDEIAEKVQKLQEQNNPLKEALEEYDKNGELSAETAQSLLVAGYEDYIDIIDDKIVLLKGTREFIEKADNETNKEVLEGIKAFKARVEKSTEYNKDIKKNIENAFKENPVGELKSQELNQDNLDNSFEQIKELINFYRESGHALEKGGNLNDHLDNTLTILEGITGYIGQLDWSKLGDPGEKFVKANDELFKTKKALEDLQILQLQYQEFFNEDGTINHTYLNELDDETKKQNFYRLIGIPNPEEAGPIAAEVADAAFLETKRSAQENLSQVGLQIINYINALKEKMPVLDLILNLVINEEGLKEVSTAVEENAGFDFSSETSEGQKAEVTQAETWGADKLKDLKKFEDRYHDINKQLENQERLLSKIDTQSSRAFGGEKLDLYEQQLEEISDQIDLVNKKTVEANTYLAEDKARLSEVGLDNVLINVATGEIENYEAVVREITERFNALRTEEAEKLYNEQIAALQKYEETLKVIQELEDAYEEARRKEEDIKLQKVTYELDVVLEIKNMEQVARDFSKKVAESLGDNLTNSLDIAEIDYDSMKAELALLDNYEEQYEDLQDLFRNANEYTNMDELLKSVSDLQGKIVDSGEALLDWIKTVEEILPNALDAAKKRLDEFTKQFSHNSSILNTAKELLILQGYTADTEEGFAALQKITQGQMDISIAQARQNKVVYEGLKKELAEAELALKKVSEDDAEYKTLKANKDALLESVNEAQKAMLESGKAAMEAAKEVYSAAIDKAIKDFENKVTNGLGFDLLQTKYDHLIEKEERYLDAVNETYQVTKWNNKLQRDIDKTTFEIQKKKLKDLQKEMDIRRENGKLSQYDLDILEAKYEMTLAQIALEEAQNNKSQLRMVRDSAGNWGYQYTANQDAINEATDNYLDAENSYYNTAKDQVQKGLGEIISFKEQITRQMQEIQDNETLSEEEKNARMEELREYALEKYQYLMDEYGVAYSDLLAAGGEWTAQFGTAYDEIIQEMGLSTQDFEEIFNDTMNEVEQAAEDYRDVMNDVAEDLGLTYEDLTETIDETSQATAQLGEQSIETAGEIIDAVSEIHEASQAYAEYTDRVLEAVEALKELAEAQAELGDDISSSRRSSRDDDDEDEEDNSWDVGRPTQVGSGGSNSSSSGGKQNPGTGVGSYNKNNPPPGWSKEEWEKEWKRMSGFDTGGYTGDFSGGKLAVLHEKELVLNKEDTENILGAVSTVREIGPSIFKFIGNLLDKINLPSFDSFVSRLTGGASSGSGASTIEQNVTIHADFPAANSAAEIEMALNNLMNDAAQHVSIRKN